MSPTTALAYLHRASQEPIGLILHTNNTGALRGEFYSALSNNHLTTEDLDIMICVPDEADYLYIVRRSVELD